jgi:hypothetical protein
MRVRDIKPGEQFEDTKGNVWLKTREPGGLQNSTLCVLIVRKNQNSDWPQSGNTSSHANDEDAFPVGYRG